MITNFDMHSFLTTNTNEIKRDQKVYETQTKIKKQECTKKLQQYR